MKITAFYYLDYPDDAPADSGFAATVMRVEVGHDDDTIDHFQHTYAFQVYTARYVETEFFAKRLPLVGRSVLIVPELDDAWMLAFLTANISGLAEWGEQVGL